VKHENATQGSIFYHVLLFILKEMEALTHALRDLTWNNLTKSNRDYTNILGLEWDNELAMQKANNIADSFPYSSIDPTPGGHVIWRNVPTSNGHSWYESRITDGFYLHTKPGDHGDFYFFTTIMSLKAHKIPELSKISGSITYYSVGKELTTGCHFEGAAVGTMTIVKMFNDDEINLHEAQRLYDVYIKKLTAELPADLNGDPTPWKDAMIDYIFSGSPVVEIKKSRTFPNPRTPVSRPSVIPGNRSGEATGLDRLSGLGGGVLSAPVGGLDRLSGLGAGAMSAPVDALGARRGGAMSAPVDRRSLGLPMGLVGQGRSFDVSPGSSRSSSTSDFFPSNQMGSLPIGTSLAQAVGGLSQRVVVRNSALPRSIL
jgi:hypothetical protein